MCIRDSGTHTIYRNPSVLNLSNPVDQDLACDATSTTFTLSYDDLATVTTVSYTHLDVYKRQAVMHVQSAYPADGILLISSF